MKIPDLSLPPCILQVVYPVWVSYIRHLFDCHREVAFLFNIGYFVWSAPPLFSNCGKLEIVNRPSDFVSKPNISKWRCVPFFRRRGEWGKRGRRVCSPESLHIRHTLLFRLSKFIFFFIFIILLILLEKIKCKVTSSPRLGIAEESESQRGNQCCPWWRKKEPHGGHW